jgi:hypothetical protein
MKPYPFVRLIITPLFSLITVTALAAAPPSQQSSHLVALWHADGQFTDTTGHQVNVQGDIPFSPGVTGSSFSFDGSGPFLAVPDSSDFKPQSITVEAWALFTAEDTKYALRRDTQYVAFKRNTRYDCFEGYALLKTDDDAGVDRLSFVVTSAAGNQVCTWSKASVQLGRWYHLAGTYDGTTVRLYVDGEIQDERHAGFPLDYGSRPLFIGSSGEKFWPGNLSGLLDEVAVYNTALTAPEIQHAYERKTLSTVFGVTAPAVTLRLSPRPTLQIKSIPGQAYEIQTATNLAQGIWKKEGSFTAQNPEELWPDPDPAAHPQRFYKVVPISADAQ